MKKSTLTIVMIIAGLITIAAISWLVMSHQKANQLPTDDIRQTNDKQSTPTKDTYDESTLSPEERRNQDEKVQRYREENPEFKQKF